MFTELVSLTEALEYRGRWWLPEQPKNQISGLFGFSPVDGIVLELDGVLDQKDENTEIGPDYSIILGLLNSGMPITLCGCYLTETSTSYHSSKRGKSKLYVERAFIGVDYESAEACKLKSLEVRFAGLDEWSFRKCFDNERKEFVQSQLNVIKLTDWFVSHGEPSAFHSHLARV